MSGGSSRGRSPHRPRPAEFHSDWHGSFSGVRTGTMSHRRGATSHRQGSAPHSTASLLCGCIFPLDVRTAYDQLNTVSYGWSVYIFLWKVNSHSTNRSLFESTYCVPTPVAHPATCHCRLYALSTADCTPVTARAVSRFPLCLVRQRDFRDVAKRYTATLRVNKDDLDPAPGRRERGRERLLCRHAAL